MLTESGRRSVQKEREDLIHETIEGLKSKNQDDVY
jgi:hypothetical protein